LYQGPTVAAEQLAQKLKEFGYTEDARIMDLGCGTGLVGVELQKRGYKNIDGVDLMPEMLEEAKAKGVYGSLQQGSMGSPGCKDLGVDANQYDAVTCIGVLTIAHAKSEGLHDLVHVVKPGGLMCFTIRDFSLNSTKCGYGKKMDQLCQEGKWKLLTKEYMSAYVDDGSAWCFVYQKL
jgi:predicted TPR repeat methyltransferase